MERASNGVLTEGTPAWVLQEKIESRKAVVGVIGLGYVGLPLAVSFAEKGFHTLGIDLNPDRVRRLQDGENYIQDVADQSLAAVVQNGSFEADTGFERAGEVDVLFICVPTPVKAHKDPDVSYIQAATESIAPHLRAGQLIVLKSTTWPGTTQELVGPILERAAKGRGLCLGRDYFLAFSPERIDPGNRRFNVENTPVVVGGMTPVCTKLTCMVLSRIVGQVHAVSSPKVAEMEKLLENIFRSVNIALVNELARLCDRMGDVSIWEVVEAAATKPFGYMPFYPGPGLGGHCIPIDPYYLSWLARRYDFETGFITLSARLNEEMPYYVVDVVTRVIAEAPVKLAHARVLLLGVAFKRDVDDIRHAPALKIIRLLQEKGITRIDYADPFVPVLQVEHPDGQAEVWHSVSVTPEMLHAYDVVVLVTDHTSFPYPMIAREAGRIVDTRNAFKGVELVDRGKIRLIGHLENHG